MGVAYPLLILEKDDGSARVFTNEEHLNSWVEPTDVKNNEYLAWDRAGHPTELYLEGQKVCARPTKHGENLATYVKATKPNSPDLELLSFALNLIGR